MKYTIDEENKVVIIHSFGEDDRVEDLIGLLAGYEEFSVTLNNKLKNQNISHTMITDSGYKYDYVPDKNPYEITSFGETGIKKQRECDCGRNGAICSCELTNQK